MAESCCLDLIGLAKPVLNVKYDPFDLKELMKDETAIFMGALLCKFSMIDSTRTKVVKLTDPAFKYDDLADEPHVRSIIMTSGLTSLSCTPNAKHCLTFDNKVIMYAIAPIKQGTQIFSSPHSSSVYSVVESVRQFFHKSFYQKTCDCRACIDNWDELLKNPDKVSSTSGAKSEILKELKAELDSIKETLECHPSFSQFGIVESHFIDRIRGLVVNTWKHFPMPSHITKFSVKFLIEIFEKFFTPPGLRETKVHYWSGELPSFD
ncbi:hypothetical protein QAD02_001284 [Eretmocerus hayati]|uniref:Uncharacterized protein n=1 Tax=Eretmocerus hayati TaxID=131215 RepID=A0ACC2NFU0_9HYME|nr:hypothetical protein QAD02_001284 [Eretmocerus hayati]